MRLSGDTAALNGMAKRFMEQTRDRERFEEKVQTAFSTKSIDALVKNYYGMKQKSNINQRMAAIRAKGAMGIKPGPEDIQFMNDVASGRDPNSVTPGGTSGGGGMPAPPVPASNLQSGGFQAPSNPFDMTQAFKGIGSLLGGGGQGGGGRNGQTSSGARYTVQ